MYGDIEHIIIRKKHIPECLVKSRQAATEEPGPATEMGLRPKRARADGQLPPLSQPPLYIIVRS